MFTVKEQELHRHVRLNDLRKVKKLIKSNKIDINSHEPKNHWTPIHYAAGNDFFDILRVLVHVGGANTESKALGGYTALHYASMQGFLKTVQYLVTECKADVFAKDDSGQTALHHACRFGRYRIVTILVESVFQMSKKRGKEYLNTTDTNGISPIDIAYAEGNDDIAQDLIYRLIPTCHGSTRKSKDNCVNSVDSNPNIAAHAENQ